MTLPAGDRRLLRHVLLQPRLRVLRAAARPRPPAPGLGEPLRVRRADRDRRRARAGRPPADARVAPGDVHEEDRPVLLADRPALEARRLDPARDRPEGPAGHAAPDGALLLADRERRQARHAARRSTRSTSPAAAATTSTRPRPKPSNVDPAALAVVRDGLYRATHASYGTATAVFGNFPIPIAGKTGTAEKVVQPPGYAQPLLQDQSWWCGYGPADATETPKIAVCAVIENGGHGGTAAAPAALKVFEQFFHTKTHRRPRADPLRLAMADLVYTPTERSRARARRRELTQEAPLLARLDWVMLGAVLAHRRATGSGRSPASRATTCAGSPDYYVYRQLVFVAIGLRRPRRRDPDRPRDLPPLREADLRRDARSCSCSCSSPARSPAARSAGSTSASSASSRPSSGSCSSSSRSPASSPTGSGGWASGGRR